MTTTYDALPAAGGHHPERAKAAIWRRRWVQLTGVGVLAFTIGAAGGSGSTNTHTAELSAATTKVADLSSSLDSANSQVASLQQQLSAANDQITAAQDKAAQAMTEAKKQVAAQNAATAQKLAAQKASLDQRSRDLDAREAKVTGEEAAYANNTVPGTGTYVVGKDIQPGTYHADALPGCYWSRLSSLDTWDIIDNDNADGPVTVQILASDTAFKTDGCADFHKIG